MNALLNLQRRFCHSLLLGRDDIGHLLEGDDVFLANSPINIYKNAYRMRLLESLTTDYPILEQVLGKDLFRELAEKYISEYPSSSYSLRDFGQHLSVFLKQQMEYQTQPYLSEMAEFEWQLVDIFDLADTSVANIDDVSCIKAEDWPQLTIKLHSSIRWLSLHWNIVEVYQALRANTQVPELAYVETVQHCLIWRKQYSPYFRLVEAKEWYVLQIAQRSNFTKLCSTLAEFEQTGENAAFDAATYLKSWLLADLIESVSIADK